MTGHKLEEPDTGWKDNVSLISERKETFNTKIEKKMHFDTEEKSGSLYQDTSRHRHSWDGAGNGAPDDVMR